MASLVICFALYFIMLRRYNANTGNVIELAFTCPEAVTSLPGYCMKNMHEVLEFNKADKAGWVIVLKK